MDKEHPAPGAGPMGLAIFLASLAMFFAASIVGYLAVRLPAPDWPPPGMPAFPRLLWLSTFILLVSSLSMHWALRGARTGDQGALKSGMVLTTFFGLSFLVCQLWSWKELLDLNLGVEKNLYGFTFYLLTALHAVHVIGGLIPLCVTCARSFRGRYGPENSTGVLMCAMYWHFLDVVWVVLFTVLVVFG